MAVYCRSLYSWRRTARLATFVTVFIAWVFVAVAQTPQPPYALFQQATLTGSGNTITATQIPVVTASGATVYLNATLQFNVDSNGNLTISSGFPQISPAPTLITGNIKAGRYVGPSNILGGKAIITVTGPGVTDGGATEWSLSLPTGADPGTYPSSASWYVGPMASNPLAARLSKAGITSTAFSYGVASSQLTSSQGSNYGSWFANTLIGVSQIGNTITIVSFTTQGSDYNTPRDQITYTLAPTP